MWVDFGGSFVGCVVNGQVMFLVWLMVEVQLLLLLEVICDINKYSNNVMVCQVLLMLGVEMIGQFGDIVNVVCVVCGWFNDKGIDINGLVIENGVGFLCVECVMLVLLVSVLVQVYCLLLMLEFVFLLLLVGYDGIMCCCLKMQSVVGQVYIKIGMFNDVCLIVGYVQVVLGKIYVVVFLINYVVVFNGQQVQDVLLQWVYENG